jgi:hypothetical protein
MRHRFYIFVKDRRGDTSFVFSILNNYLYYVKKKQPTTAGYGAFSNVAHNLYILRQRNGGFSGQALFQCCLTGFTGFAGGGSQYTLYRYMVCSMVVCGVRCAVCDKQPCMSCMSGSTRRGFARVALIAAAGLP